LTILVTGGAGYIGSHACVELLNSGHDIVVFDNYYNSSPEVLDRIKEITGRSFLAYECDMLDEEAMERIFSENKIDAVMHFAGYKAVGESCEKPLMYYHNNIQGTLTILNAMARHNVKKFVFSSSATVYGDPQSVPIDETFPLSATNPYGRTKLMIEEMLRDLYAADNSWSIILLRYFNPVGAHESYIIGENPKGIPNNLMPMINKVAQQELPVLKIFGNDYNTKDGTGVRDYIHVVDLAKGHVKAIEYIENYNTIESINLGTGKGYSVLEMVHTYMRVNNVAVNYIFTDRRPGDIAECYANPEKALRLLNWKAEYDLEKMCRDSYLWSVSATKR
jgi:UDP-glucose 4-epimerase